MGTHKQLAARKYGLVGTIVQDLIKNLPVAHHFAHVRWDHQSHLVQAATCLPNARGNRVALCEVVRDTSDEGTRHDRQPNLCKLCSHTIEAFDVGFVESDIRAELLHDAVTRFKYLPVVIELLCTVVRYELRMRRPIEAALVVFVSEPDVGERKCSCKVKHTLHVTFNVVGNNSDCPSLGRFHVCLTTITVTPPHPPLLSDSFSNLQ